MNNVEMREKVIKGLECCTKKVCIFKDTMKECPYWELCGEYEGAFEDCTSALAKDVLALLKVQELISDQDLKDLDILRRVKEGKLAKSLCRDYVIYNGEWYRNHKWDWPNQEPLEPRIVDGEPECGMCLYELRRYADNYCPCCGRKVKWDD